MENVEELVQKTGFSNQISAFKLERGSGDSVYKDNTIRGKIQENKRNAFVNVVSPYTMPRLNVTGISPEKGYILEGKAPFSNELFPYFTSIIKLLEQDSAFRSDAKNSLQNFTELYTQYNNIIKNQSQSLTAVQKKQFVEILRQLSKTPYLLDLNPIVKISVDDELIVVRGSAKGNHYIVVGSEDNEITFGFVGRRKGEYRTLHFSPPDNTISSIIIAFIQ